MCGPRTGSLRAGPTAPQRLVVSTYHCVPGRRACAPWEVVACLYPRIHVVYKGGI